MDRAWLNLGPTLMILGLVSAEGPHFFTLAVPGNHWVGPYDPVGAPCGRRGHGRLRRPTHANLRGRERVNTWQKQVLEQFVLTAPERGVRTF